MNVEAFRPCSAVQIQYVSIALTCSRVGLAAPAQQELLGRGLALRDDVVRRRLACRRRRAAERATIAIICAESRPRSSRACSSEISISLPSFHSPARRAVSAWRSAGALPVSAAGLVRLRVGHLRVEVVVDEQPPHVLVGVLADELLDVDAAVAERAALAVGLGDLRLDGDDALEAWLEVVHRLDRPGNCYSA